MDKKKMVSLTDLLLSTKGIVATLIGVGLMVFFSLDKSLGEYRQLISVGGFIVYMVVTFLLAWQTANKSGQ